MNHSQGLVLQANFFTNLIFSQLICDFRLNDGLKAVLLLKLRNGQEVLEGVFRGQVVHNLNLDDSVSKFAIFKFDFVQRSFFYFFVFLKDLRTLDGRARIRELYLRKNTSKLSE